MKTLVEGIAQFRLRATLAGTLCVASLALGASFPAQAQNLSDQPIRIATPHAPGFGFDISLRRLAPELSKLLGQSVRIENHPVAAGQAAAFMAEPTAASTPSERTFVFALWTPRPVSFAKGVKLACEPICDFVPVLRITAANLAGTAEAPAQYAGFIAPAGTHPRLIAQLREAMFKVMAQDPLKAWSEVMGDPVALIDGPGYTRFLETAWVHLKQVPDSKVANSARLKPE